MSIKSTLWNSRTLVTRSRYLAPIGSAVLQTISWAMRHRPLQSRTRKLRDARYLNAGCGLKPRLGFVNLDYIWHPGVDLVWDLNRRLPFKDGSLYGIYTEHCLEHLPFDLVTRHVLPEFRRVLMPRGRLRLIVPDGGLYIKLYMDGLNGKPDVKFPRPNDAFVTPMMYVNECFRDWGHLYAYDFVTFQFFIKAAGFSDVVQRKYMEGDDPALLLDSPERAEESLFIEAVNF